MSVRASLLTLLLLAFGSQAGTAQVRVVQGRVLDATTGAAVESPNVTVVGTLISTVGGADGTFTLREVPVGTVTLLVRRIGFRRLEVQLAVNQNEVTIELEPDILRLEEVVVTGQATGIARRNLPNAVSTVSAADLDRAPAETIERALQGKVAGANIQTNSNAPGGGVQVELRGITSLIGGQPLYVVDGVIVSNAAITSNLDAVTQASTGSNPSGEQDNQVNRITDLNPADIESIEILKGASASAIYGSKASNGVIIITTKRGRAGPAQINLSQRFGFFDLARTITRRFDTAEEVDAAFGAGTAAQFNFDPDRNWEEDVAGYNPLSFETNLSVSGGDEDTRFFVSGIWKDDDGVIANDGFDKQGLRVNLDQQLNDRLTLQVSTNLVRTLTQRGISGNDNTGTSPWFAGLSIPRFIDLTRQADGTFPDNPFAQSNPVQTVNLLVNDEEVWRFIGSARLEFDAIRTARHNVRLIGVSGVDRFSQENEIFSPPEMQFEGDDGLLGTSALTNANSEFFNLSGNVVWDFTPGSTRWTTSAGIQYDVRDLNLARITTKNLLGGQRNVDQGSSLSVEETRERREDLGFYVQEEVLIDDRLLLTAGVRADQTSGSTQADKLFAYPKAAASYRFDIGSETLEDIKIRSAYGESGKQPDFGQRFTPLDGSERIEGLLGFQVGGSTAGAIEPERQREFEVGIDATLFNGRASVEATGYRRSVSNLLLTRSLAPSTGFARETFNGGSMRVTGVEAAVTLAPVQSASIGWILRGTFGSNRSKMTELPVPPFVPEPGKAGFVFGPGLGAFCIEEGASATQIIGNVPGDMTACGNQFGVAGDANPDFRVGIASDLSWGSVNLYLLLDWQQGGDVINLTKLLYDLGNNYFDCTDDASNPCGARLSTFGSDIKSTYVEDATFVKLRELTISWDVPESIRTQLWGPLRHARLMFSGRNLLVMTDYTGMDPEVSNFGTQAVGRSVDVAAYPRTRSFFFGFDLGF